MSGSILSVLTDLIAFPTVSDRSNLACIDYLEERLHALGFRCERFADASREKASLYAEIGPQETAGLLFAGHTDVVPVTDQVWEKDPFAAWCDEHHLYGRGSSDMKGFLAAILTVLPDLPLSELTAPLSLVFTYDEEVGCCGAKQMEPFLSSLPCRPRLAIIGEPTGMEWVNAHKSLHLTETTVHGQSAHSSAPHLGANSILFTAELIRELKQLLPTEEDSRFMPPTATFNVGRVEGGQAVNIVPERCQIEWETRLLPHQEADALFDRWHTAKEKLLTSRKGITIDEQRKASVPALASEGNEASIAELRTHVKEVNVTTAPFVTEAGIYQRAGIPTLVCGPGTLDQAHKPNERVSIAQLEACQELLKLLVHSYCCAPQTIKSS